MAWTVTALAGIQVDQQFIIFRASGAIVHTVLAGLMLQVLLPRVTAQLIRTSEVVGPASDNT
jgi:hypothetical protein